MTLQNRMTPTGELIAIDARGAWMGNRGGRIHDPRTRTLLKRRWASRRWIICVCEFKNRQRTVMGDGYTEVFFSDEAAALAAGHRPCFECRRIDAVTFRDAFCEGIGKSVTTDEMDRILHAERLTSSKNNAIRLPKDQLHNLPDGVFVEATNGQYLIRDGKAYLWRYEGYGAPVSFEALDTESAALLTPSSTWKAIASGYTPVELRVQA